jgi:transcriptional regulator with XRE-family HTH domain
MIIIRLKALACPPSLRRSRTQEQIAEVVGISQGRVAQIINNTNFGKINNLLSQGRDMDYIAKHYHMNHAMGSPFDSYLFLAKVKR